MEMVRKLLFAIALLSVSGDAAAVRGQKGAPLKEKMPWYHSTQEIHDEIADIATACQGAQIELTTKSKINAGDAAGTEVAIDVLKVRKAGASSRTKAMFVFGEHARELVSPESSLDLLRTLCGQGSGSSRASSLLDKVEFTIVPNANPLGRKKVEEGYYCKRTNEDNVDLNRNWGEEHRGDAMKFMGDEMDPGPSGFSEPETQILKELAEEVHPDVYLSIHSGAYLLGAPFGYTADKVASNEASQVEILKPISERYCGGGCPYGGLAELIGYKSMGCDIDYMAEHVQTPYAYTWEIYVGPEIRKHYVAEAESRSGGGMADGDQDFFAANSNLNLVQKTESRQHRAGGLRGRRKWQARTHQQKAKASRLKMWHERPESEQDWDSCIEQFNPRSAEETRQVVENWTGAYLDLAESVDAKRHQESSQQETKTPKQVTSAPTKDAHSIALAAEKEFEGLRW